jgi:hypothetical protein
MIGENVAEKVGARWSLSRFMMANWGNKVNELEKEGDWKKCALC